MYLDATTTSLESAGEKDLNPTVPELIENLQRQTLKKEDIDDPQS